MTIAEKPGKRPCVFLLVHGDIWGAPNANHLFEAFYGHADMVLIVSTSTRDKNGLPLVGKSQPEMKLPRALGEVDLLNYFNFIETSLPAFEGPCIVDTQPSYNYLTFNQLAKRFCVDGIAHYTTCSGEKGGDQIQEIFNTLEKQGITPDLVMSGDTLAVLPTSITDNKNYHCFGMHPGPLGDAYKVKGLYGPARSVLHKIFYDENDNLLPRGPSYAGELVHIKGTFFKLVGELDEGYPIVTALGHYIMGQSLNQVQGELYYCLVEKIYQLRDVLLDPEKRNALVAQAIDKVKKEREERLKAGIKHAEVDVLHTDHLSPWLSFKDVKYRPAEKLSPKLWSPHDKPEAWEVTLPNKVIDPEYFRTIAGFFYPEEIDPGLSKAQQEESHARHMKEFDHVFETFFGDRLAAIERVQNIRQRLAAGNAGQKIWTPY